MRSGKSTMRDMNIVIYGRDYTNDIRVMLHEIDDKKPHYLVLIYIYVKNPNRRHALNIQYIHLLN